MNLIKETKSKLQFCVDNLADLQEIGTKDNLSRDCYNYIGREIDRYERNIKYYEEILKVLEEKK